MKHELIGEKRFFGELTEISQEQRNYGMFYCFHKCAIRSGLQQPHGHTATF
ncbi:MAG: hypothetical protein PUH24_09745 [Prevotellaceae bacterium]|nr:hypothetical protein [Prevotella sp.]MDD7258529.1 hypothetical protein [Prevotellaceae bacterium]MDY6131526.1 hypothetical protein [Prevotella sp.]